MRGSGRLHRWREGEGEQKKRRESAHVVKEWGKVLKNCLWGPSCRETMRVAKRSRVSCQEKIGVRRAPGTTTRSLGTLRKGLPRFVVFIMWEEVLGPSGEEDMATGPRDRMWKRG